MLLAELHGHAIPEAQDNEDLLTSTVFGHLRYIPPRFFWAAFLSCATNSGEMTLTAFLADRGCSVWAYQQVRTLFWPKHSKLGWPDLILCFSGGAQRPFVLVVECKLWAEKSGFGEFDQLSRYLNLAEELKGISPPLAFEEIHDAHFAVLYLTPRESLSEIEETARLREANHDSHLLFRAQWQDIIECFNASTADGALDGISATILRDVALFLQRRGLAYFRGFLRCDLTMPPPRCGYFYSSTSVFRRRRDLRYFPVEKARWVAI